MEMKRIIKYPKVVLTAFEAVAILRYIRDVESDTNIVHVATPTFQDGYRKLIVAHKTINEEFKE